MSKNRNGFILLAGVLLAGGLTWAALTAKEPNYAGRSLSQWLAIYQTSEAHSPELKEAEVAIQNIGTNAIPSLLTWIAYEPSPLKIYCVRTVQRLRETRFGGWIPDSSSRDRAPYYRAYGAGAGFALLGARARPAIPALARMASDPRKKVAAERAAEALGDFGLFALPELVCILTNKVAPGRRYAAKAISALGTNALPALPVVLQCVRDEDESVAVNAVMTLFDLRSQQGVVLPALTNALSDSRPYVRFAAAKMLQLGFPGVAVDASLCEPPFAPRNLKPLLRSRP